ncbi:MAG: hypothetical protein QOJ46_2575, partial [bacterium]
LRVADRRAEAELRRFKAQVEALDPDDYPPPENDETEGDDPDDDDAPDDGADEEE